MSSSLSLTLFSGHECELCDIAKEMVEHCRGFHNFELTVVNVKKERQYFHQYGARIPVLQRHDNQDELGWPFDIEQLNTFLSGV